MPGQYIPADSSVAANQSLSGPVAGSPGVAAFRPLVAADLPAGTPVALYGFDSITGAQAMIELGTNLSVASHTLNAAGGSGVPTGAANNLLTYNAAATAVALPLGATIYASNYGARGDGTTDDTVAIQDAIAAAGAYGVVQLNPGATYKLSQKGTTNGVGYCLQLTTNFQTIFGHGAILANSSATADTVSLDPGTSYTQSTLVRGVRIFGVLFQPSVPRNTGACEVRAPYFAGFEMHYCSFGGIAEGLVGILGNIPGTTANVVGTFLAIGNSSTSGCGGGRFTHINGVNYFRAYDILNVIDCLLQSWYADAYIVASQHGRITGNCQALQVNVCDFVCTQVSSGYNLIINDNGLGSGITFPFTNRFENCYFDSAQGVQINAGMSLIFSNCWASAGRVGVAWSIPANSTANVITFSDCEATATGGPGFEILAGTGHRITNPTCLDIGRNGPNIACVHIGAGSDSCIISGGTFGPNSLSAVTFGEVGNAAYSIQIDNGSLGTVASACNLALPILNNAGSAFTYTPTPSQFFLDQFKGTASADLETRTASTGQAWSQGGGMVGEMELGPSGDVWALGAECSYRVAYTPGPTEVIVWQFKYVSKVAGSAGIWWNASQSLETGYLLRVTTDGTVWGFESFTMTNDVTSNHNVLNSPSWLIVGHTYEVVVTPNGAGVYAVTYRDITAFGVATAAFTITDSSFASGLLGLRGEGPYSSTTGFHTILLSTSQAYIGAP